MSTAIVEPTLPEPEGNYLENGYSLRSWLTTTDHKRIAILYAVTITAFFFMGGTAATLMRLELISPTPLIMGAETYNKLFTAHGVIMVWFFLIPSIPATLGNFLIPMMVGAKDVALPRVNLLSWYIFVLGGMFVFVTLIAGGIDTGWTFYVPLSTRYSDTQVVYGVVGIFIAGFSSILTGLNFIVTVHRLRAPGLTWFKLPLFVWAIYATSIILVLATPVLAMTLVLLAMQRVFGLGIFDALLGGDPILFQHMFWFYSHPAVYIMVLPAMGVASEVISCFARKPVFGYRTMAYAIAAIAAFGFMVWGHHLFVAGQSLYASLVFSFLSYVVAIPSAIKVFNWTATLYKGSITFEAPMLYALGFVGLFLIGGLTGLYLASLALDANLSDTYFVVAHFHYIMVGGSVMAYFAGIHFWWPKITGRMYPESWSRLAAIVIFIGFNLTFFPQFILGLEGMPRRYFEYAPQFQFLNILSSAGASILAAGYALPVLYLTWSIRHGPHVGRNPWGAKGLEWQTRSPPPVENFDVPLRIPERPYDYDPEAEEAKRK